MLAKWIAPQTAVWLRSGRFERSQKSQCSDAGSGRHFEYPRMHQESGGF